MKDPTQKIRDAIARNRREAVEASTRMGHRNLMGQLKGAQRALERRIRVAEGLKGPGKGSFTAVQLRAAMRQVRDVAGTLKRGVGEVVVDTADRSAEQGAEQLVRYLRDADQAYRGVGARPMRLDEAAVMDQAVSGNHSTVLRRLMSDPEHPARQGILDRYGEAVVGHFEGVLREAMLTGAPWGEVRDQLVEKSEFLQGMPKFWSERILRTESAGAYNRSAWEGAREADEQLGDVVKILCCPIDDRAAADSLAAHGEVRRVDELFEDWNGTWMHPPGRPNDRACVVTHRLAWPFPDALKWRPIDEVRARWIQEGHKKPMPKRPLMTTVPLELFGKP